MTESLIRPRPRRWGWLIVTCGIAVIWSPGMRPYRLAVPALARPADRPARRQRRTASSGAAMNSRSSMSHQFLGGCV